MFLAHDLTGRQVVIRTFDQPLDAGERERLLDALVRLTGTSLDHPGIAAPLDCGIEGERLFIAHACLDGEVLADMLARGERPVPADVLVQVTALAGALDFAAAAGVLHGALSARDIIWSEAGAAVSGLGLVQAVAATEAERADDIRSLAFLTRELLGPAAERVDDVFAAALGNDRSLWPASALAFAAVLQDAWTASGAPSEPSALPQADVDWDRASSDVEFDVPLRDAGDDIELPTPSVPIASFEAEAETASRAPLAEPRFAATHAASGLRPAVLIGGVALVGLLVAFASGLFVGRSDEPDRSVATAGADASMERPSPGQGYTDQPIARPPVTASPAPSTSSAPAATNTEPRPSTRVSPDAGSGPAPRSAPRTGVEEPRTRSPQELLNAEPAPTGPAALQVATRPAGAQVFVDGRSVGYTPLVVGGLAPGTHGVRLELAGYRPVVTAVTLGPGARERLAASLEQ